MTNPTDEFTKAVESALGKVYDAGASDGHYDTPPLAADEAKPEALASIQASTVSLFLELVGEDEQPHRSLKSARHARNKFRAQLRAKIDQLIKDLTPKDGEGK